MINTEFFFRELTIACLNNDDKWKANKDEAEGYIVASNSSGKKDIIICSVGRVLSTNNKKETISSEERRLESTTVLAPKERIEKMLEYNEENGNKYTPCISYGVAKYSMDEFELFIVPVDAIEDKAERGSAYSKTEYGYHYNYIKLENEKKPIEAIMRKCWKLI